MVDLITQTQQSSKEAIRSLLNDGYTVQEVHQLVSTVATEVDGRTETNGVIYAEVPVGLQTLEGVERQLGVNRATVRTWIRRQHLRERGRLRAPGRGGGKILVSIADVQRIMEDPPKNGRPVGFRPSVMDINSS